MTLVYEYRSGSVYINVTNRCTCRCSFCARTHGVSRLGPYDLTLDQDPAADEVQEALEEFLQDAGRPVTAFKEFVFCGYGEPTLRGEVLENIAGYLKSRGAVRIRLNTNGHLLLIGGRELLERLVKCIDVMSVSLNAPDAETYNRVCSPRGGADAFYSVVACIKLARDIIPEVVVTAVDEGTVDIEGCHRLAEELGVKFRVR